MPEASPRPSARAEAGMDTYTLTSVSGRSLKVVSQLLRLQTKNVQYPIRCNRDALMSVDREGDRIGNNRTACLEIP